MSSYIADHLDQLRKRHYIRKAAAKDYWHDFHARRLSQYCSLYGDDFCLVVYGSSDEDDAYVIPHRRAHFMYDHALLDSRGRWIGNIADGTLILRRSKQSLCVSGFYNAFEYIHVEIEDGVSNVDDHDRLSLDATEDLKNLIVYFNRQYHDVAPHRRRALSEQISRPGSISKYVKELRDYTCQLCGEEGFMMKSGNRYAETHHLEELHRSVPGSYCSDNIIVVCATCHRKLHYASVKILSVREGLVELVINDEHCSFERNIIS